MGATLPPDDAMLRAPNATCRVHSPRRSASMPHPTLRRASVAVAALAVALLAPPAGALAGETTATQDAVVTLVSPAEGSTVERGFTAAFDVALGDQDDTTLTATFGGDDAVRTVTRAECAD